MVVNGFETIGVPYLSEHRGVRAVVEIVAGVLIGVVGGSRILTKFDLAIK